MTSGYQRVFDLLFCILRGGSDSLPYGRSTRGLSCRAGGSCVLASRRVGEWTAGVAPVRAMWEHRPRAARSPIYIRRLDIQIFNVKCDCLSLSSVLVRDWFGFVKIGKLNRAG